MCYFGSLLGRRSVSYRIFAIYERAAVDFLGFPVCYVSSIYLDKLINNFTEKILCLFSFYLPVDNS